MTQDEVKDIIRLVLMALKGKCNEFVTMKENEAVEMIFNAIKNDI